MVDPHSVPPVTRRAELRVAATIGVASGCWLLLAPWILNYAADDPAWADLIAGVVVATIGALRLTGRMHSSRITLLSAAVACWLLLSAALVAASDAARINEAASGLVVLTAAALGTAVSASRRRLLRARRARDGAAHDGQQHRPSGRNLSGRRP